MAFLSEKASEGDYRLLGVTPRASRKEVKSAYRRLAKEWHPDRFQQRSEKERILAEEKFKTLTAAYRRIAGGWLEDEPAGEGVRRNESETSKPEKKPFQEGGRVRRPRRMAAGFSWPMRRRGTMAVGVMTAALLFLLAVRAYLPGSGTSGPSSTGSIRPSEPRPSPAVPGEPLLSRSVPPAGSPDQERTSAEDARPRRPPVPDRSMVPDGEVKSEFISIGSTQEDVLRIQGPPGHVRGQTWVYGVSELVFKENRVVRFNNFDGNLKVRVLPSSRFPQPPPKSFTIGSSADEVLWVQGTPTRMDESRWLYGFSEVRFKDGRVEEYDNFFGDLNIRLIPSEAGGTVRVPDAFTVGSSMNDVLLIQGTPTSIRGNLWYYQMSSILFRRGKVHYVYNLSGNLKYVPRETSTRKD
jgi:hypothetical protein